MSNMFAKIKNVIFKPVFIITFLTLASKVLGFVRDILTDHKVDRLSSDLLLNANTVSEYLSTFLLMGTIYSSVLPIASKYDSQEKENVELSKYLNLVTLALSL